MDPRTLLIATTNPGKVREIRLVLDGVPCRFVTLGDLAPIPEPEETGRTFEANARLKAEYYARASNLPTVAEDSGLAIDTLGGQPGVESARYPGATYPDKFQNLYRELEAHPQPWTARYVCSLVYLEPATPPRILFQCEETVEGQISPMPIGTGGFGYDPIFFYPPFGTTLGNVEDARKLTVAHRGKAFSKFRDWLMSQLV